jgi:hypothetical protein
MDNASPYLPPFAHPQAEASSQQQLDDLVVKGEKVNFDYWKRSVTILEDQIRVQAHRPGPPNSEYSELFDANPRNRDSGGR